MTDFKNIIEQFIDFNPQLVLLDIMLPFLTVFIGAVKLGSFLKCR